MLYFIHFHCSTRAQFNGFFYFQIDLSRFTHFNVLILDINKRINKILMKLYSCRSQKTFCKCLQIRSCTKNSARKIKKFEINSNEQFFWVKQK